MAKGRIYLAGPYSHDSAIVREYRFNVLSLAAGEIISKGYLVFSPISHSHPIATQKGLELGYDAWKEFDESFIEWCNEVWVLKLEGYNTSAGVKQEVEVAQRLGKLVRYISAEDLKALKCS